MQNESSGVVSARSERDVSGRHLVKAGFWLSEESWERSVSDLQVKGEKYQSKKVQVSDEGRWNRRFSGEVGTMLVGTNYSRRSGVLYKDGETLIGEATSKAEGEGGERESKEVREQGRAESDASWVTKVVIGKVILARRHMVKAEVPEGV